jgi:hypothetical protein
MEQHRLLVWKAGTCSEAGGCVVDDVREAEYADVPWCWLVFCEGKGWVIYDSNNGGEDLYYGTLMD